MIREVNGNEVLDFALSYFPNFKVSSSPFLKTYAYFIDEEVIGFITFSLIYERVEIEYFLVKDSYRRKGIGQKLFDYLISNIPYENISLEVRCSNEKAINFYLKNGFKKVSVRKNYYDGDNAYLMVKELR